MSQAMLSARGLGVGYDGRAVVEGVEFDLRAGEVLVLIGPNGSGKSTLLKTLAGEIPPVGGSVLLKSSDLAKLPAREKAQAMAVMLTAHKADDLLTCGDVVEAGRYPYTGRLGILSREDRAHVREAMELCQVWDLRERDFARVSDGQRQRVLLARAVAQEPSVLVLDEPTSYLDIRHQIDLVGVLRLLAESGTAIVASFHELPLARIAASRVLCVKDGRIAASGTPEQIFTPAVIDKLYDLRPGQYDPVSGIVSLDG